MSPNYPNASPWLNCTWTIAGPEDAGLLLYFEEIGLSGNDSFKVM